jgi:glutamyl-tRNA reductase
MELFLTGISHKTAPVEVRERVAFGKDGCAERLRTLVDGDLVREALIVSTCNRVEVLAALDPARREEGAARVCGFFAGSQPSPSDFILPHLYAHTGTDAVRHLFRVAASLDSMVLGEPQILGQVRQAYTTAVEAGTAGRLIHRLMHHAFRTAKRVRSETAIASSAVSVSYAAVELGRKILGTLEGRTVLLVGAGEMAELAARHLSKAGAARILVANRTHETACKLASEFGGEAIPYERFPSYLVEADVVICSTGARRYIIDAQMARAALKLRRNRPSFFIDISVPRNIDPAVAEVGNLFVFDVDDLESVVASNMREREREAARAERIVEAEATEFQRILHNLDIGPAVGALKDKLRRIAVEEFRRQRTHLGHLTPEQERAVEQMIVSVANKISHPLIQRMRRSYDIGDNGHTGDDGNIRAWLDSFGLEDETEVRQATANAIAADLQLVTV